MKVNGLATRTLWLSGDGKSVEIIDQTALPHCYRTLRLATLEDAALAIRQMQVRGAPLIGVTAAYGIALGLGQRSDDAALAHAVATLIITRPTAVNLHWALARMQAVLAPLPPEARRDAAWREAATIAEEDVTQNRSIGAHGLALLQTLVHADRPLNLMTHCNAGWLATVDHGTALAPIYAAFDAGIPLHVWVSETRPRNQGLLTAWELRQQGVPHTVIADNAAGWLMAEGKVDAVIVGADRIAANGDVANKIGTYLKGLAAHESETPFFVAAPRTTVDFDCPSGTDIPIEERDGDEVRLVSGLDEEGQPWLIRQLPPDSAVCNPAFDVTPARLVSRIITERGSCAASQEGLLQLYPEAKHGG